MSGNIKEGNRKHSEAEKGKPPERAGRKARGLQSKDQGSPAAGVSISDVERRKNNGKEIYGSKKNADRSDDRQPADDPYFCR